MPFVELKFQAHPGRRVFMGQSHGGLLGAQILISEPQLFRDYILGSPSFWYDNHVMWKIEADYAKAHRVRFDVADGVETWTRSCGAEIFHSEQFVGTGRAQGLIHEKFGPLTFAMALVLTGGRLSLVRRHWRTFGIPMPMFLCPFGSA